MSHQNGDWAVPAYVCEACGRLGMIEEFNDDCRPGWTHGRLIRVESATEAAIASVSADAEGSARATSRGQSERSGGS